MVGRQVGELLRAYQELNDTHEELKRAQLQLVHSEKMVSLGRLVVGFAHELNKPISFVLGNVYCSVIACDNRTNQEIIRRI